MVTGVLSHRDQEELIKGTKALCEINLKSTWLIYINVAYYSNHILAFMHVFSHLIHH